MKPNEEQNINSAIGFILTEEKYKLISHKLIGEICRDFIKAYLREVK